MRPTYVLKNKTEVPRVPELNLSTESLPELNFFLI